MNLQDSFLNHVRKENLAVIIYLVNGFQIRGLVRGFDNFTVIIENDGKQQLVYKHAISTIAPVASIQIMVAEKAEKKE
ncbi:MAG: RNA chaperone Hfq [Acidaminococcaceae bacterium]|nr:RNA chaperone Hfq [Acidaminococcaceae bacterium]